MEAMISFVDAYRSHTEIMASRGRTFSAGFNAPATRRAGNLKSFFLHQLQRQLLRQEDVTDWHSALWNEAQCTLIAAQLLDIHL